MYCPDCNTEEGTPHKKDCKLKLIDFSKNPSLEDIQKRTLPPTPFDQKEVEEGVAAMEEMLRTSKPDLETPGAVGQIANGDTYDEDTGTYLGQLTNDVDTMCSLPAQISVFYEGYWYVFKPQSRYKEEAEKGEKQI